MSKLTIFKDNDTFSAFSSNTENMAKNLSGNIFDMWRDASSLFDEEEPAFHYEDFSYQDDEFDAEWNDDLNGYEFIFKDGSNAYAQTYVETNRLHADFGDIYLERYHADNESELTEEQEKMVGDFIVQVNKLKYHFA